MTDDYIIPAASIADVDLAAIAKQDPAAAKEIVRLGDLLANGEETDEDILALCQLLHDFGEQAEAEHLLRRSLEYSESQALYARLFGTVKQEEFHASIEAFKSEFNVELEFVKRLDFLDEVYAISQNAGQDDRVVAIGNTVNFSYVLKETIEAVVEEQSSRECLMLQWVNGTWEPVDD